LSSLDYSCMVYISHCTPWRLHHASDHSLE
jgi:hypothetical protein